MNCEKLVEENIILKNKDMVWDVIHQNGLEPTEDNFQIGCIGLLKAIRKFDPERKTKLSTYAYPSILNEILMTKRRKRIPIVSYELYEGTLVSTDSYDIYENDIKQIIKDSVYGVCKPKERDIWYEIAILKFMKEEEITQNQIASEHNLTIAKTSRVINRIKNEMKRRIEIEQY